LPAKRLDDAFRRSFARASPLVFPNATPATIADHERSWWHAVVRSTFRAADPSVRFDDFEGFFAALYAEFSRAGSWRLRPGCRAMLGRLRDRGLALGVVSNFDRRLHALLADLEIAAFFDSIVLPSDAGAEKPDPAIFGFALARLGASAAEAVFVGDSQAEDIHGAHAVGMRAIDVTSLADLDEFPDRLSQLLEPSEPARGAAPPGGPE
jgi:putative hydrolase of the HAD superfamily